MEEGRGEICRLREISESVRKYPLELLENATIFNLLFSLGFFLSSATIVAFIVQSVFRAAEYISIHEV